MLTPPRAEKPPRAPLAEITRWQGTTMGYGLRPSAWPTSRARCTSPRRRAMSPYETVSPAGTVRATAYTWRSKAGTWRRSSSTSERSTRWACQEGDHAIDGLLDLGWRWLLEGAGKAPPQALADACRLRLRQLDARNA